MRRSEQNSLEAFAKRIEQRLLTANGTTTLENLICRHLTNKKNPVTAARMAEKVVEWRYGKAKETIEHKGHIEHTVFDASRLTDEQLAEAERLVESASVGSDQE